MPLAEGEAGHDPASGPPAEPGRRQDPFCPSVPAVSYVVSFVASEWITFESLSGPESESKACVPVWDIRWDCREAAGVTPGNEDRE